MIHTLVADILDRVSAKFCELELDYDCLGGGRIDHKKDEKSILVYGYSMVSEMLRPYNGVLVFATLQQGFGRADHSETVKLLKERYPEYGDQITFRNEGYWNILQIIHRCQRYLQFILFDDFYLIV